MNGGHFINIAPRKEFYFYLFMYIFRIIFLPRASICCLEYMNVCDAAEKPKHEKMLIKAC